MDAFHAVPYIASAVGDIGTNIAGHTGACRFIKSFASANRIHTVRNAIYRMHPPLKWRCGLGSLGLGVFFKCVVLLIK